ncbi:MAG: hypothetical protein H0Z33_16605 [Bacillaceae bacterium]|nr:hypothetical protein [Bacillaceae bacterium]
MKQELPKWFNLKLTSQYPFCPYALSVDFYKGCPHRCVYCFAQQQFYGNATLKVNPFDVVTAAIDLNKLERFMRGEYKGHEGPTGFLQHLISRRQPFHVGGMYDPFPRGWEEYYRVGKHALQLFNKYKYPSIISTKNPPKEYRQLFGAGDYILQVSASLPHEVALEVEFGALPVEDRLDAISALQNDVAKIVVRLQPFILGVWTEETLEQHIKAIADAGAKAVTVEFLKFSVMATAGVKAQMSKLGEMIGRNIERDLGGVEGSDRVYPERVRLKWLLIVRKLAHKHGLEFYSAENKFRDLGDGFACCGVNHNNPAEEAFFTKLRYTSNEALFIAKEKGEVTFQEMVERANDPELFRFARIGDMWNTQNTYYRTKIRNLTFYDFLYNVWHTKTPTNPAVFFKALTPFKKPDGTLAYRYVPYVNGGDGYERG